MFKWMTSMLLVAGLVVGWPMSGLAQRAGTETAQPLALTALDYFEIEQLVARYARAIDTCSNNGYDYADLFTSDGFFAPFQDGKVGNRWQGRERLAEASGGGVRGCKNVGWIEQGVLHMYVNHVITPTPEGATGTVDMLMIGLGGDPNRIEADGYYDDTYVKTPQGWRFASRIHHTSASRGQALRQRGGAAAASLSAQDVAEIEQLSARYAETLRACAADEYAGLFAGDGVFASGFRGRVEGPAALVGLVQSERHCRVEDRVPLNGALPLPTLTIEATTDGARATGVLPNNGGQYEDVYVKTADGWRFKVREYRTPQEVADAAAR